MLSYVHIPDVQRPLEHDHEAKTRGGFRDPKLRRRGACFVGSPTPFTEILSYVAVQWYH